MSQSRQLAAIMFTDIVGYTALMGEDEENAFVLLDKNRQIQRPIIEKYGGKWIKELGDGTLISFSTVTDAVMSAGAILKAAGGIPGLELRIGIHLGEVVFEYDDVFGDGVNIASRLLAQAGAGAICVSEAVHNNIVNKKGILSHFLREENLKNVKEPVRMYEVSIDPSIISGHMVETEPITHGFHENEMSKKISEKSIAVLPFINMSNDPEQEYFSDGMAEEILNSLVHLLDLKVAGRTSSFQFKGKNVDLREVGEKLGVSKVLEGSVRKQGNILRVTAQLINVENGFHLWSERYERPLDDIFAIQDEIALAITEKLKITLRENDHKIITKVHTRNREAYESYLKGRFNLNRRGAYLVSSIKYFQQAIDQDPSFALAYSGFADANLLLPAWGFLPPQTILKKAKESAKKAVELDPTLCEPYCSLGYLYTCFEWSWEEGRKHFLRSMELNPKYSQAHYWYGWNFLSWVEGNFDEAEKHGAIAIHLEPLSAICYGGYSLILNTAGKLEQALAACQTGIELDPNSFLCQLQLGGVYMTMHQHEKAIDAYQHAADISNRHHFAVNGLIWNYCSVGNLEKARSLMNEIKERYSKEYISSIYTAMSAAYLNDIDEAFEYLNKAYNDGEPNLLLIKYEPWVPLTLKQDPRYQELLEKIGFPGN